MCKIGTQSGQDSEYIYPSPVGAIQQTVGQVVDVLTIGNVQHWFGEETDAEWGRRVFYSTIDYVGDPPTEVLGGGADYVRCRTTTITECGKDAQGNPSDFTQEFNNFCYRPFDVEQAATCDSDINTLRLSSSNAETSYCHTKADDSQCVLSRASSNGQTYYAQSFEPSTCFGSDLPIFTEQALSQPSSNNCETQGTVTICPENPNNVCDSQGTCDEGCGTVGFGGQEAFVCLSDDTDLDGIGDYADPDIDGDGIPNNNDVDADGDGQDDPTYDGNGDGNGQTIGNINVTAQVDNSGVISALGEIEETLSEPFTPYTGAESGINALFTQEKIDEIISLTGTKQTEITDYISQVRTEAAALFQLPEVNGTYEQRTLALTQGNFNISLARFAGDFLSIGNIVILVATILSMFILIRANP